MVVDQVGLEREREVTVRILQVYTVLLTPDQDEVDVRHDEVATFKLRLTNTGNGNDTITISSNKNVTLEKGEVLLAPGETTTISCSVPPGDRGKEFDFTVTANSTGNSSSAVDLRVNTRYPKHETIMSDYGCLWILLIALAIFLAVQAARKARSSLKGDEPKSIRSDGKRRSGARR
jgi:hypothetical protein